MVLGAPNSSVIASDIKEAVLPGTVNDQIQNWRAITITATGSQLRSYLQSKTNLFQQLAVFQKQ